MLDLNTIVVISLALLAFFSFCFFIVLVPIALQLTRTLGSAQYLLDTINDDFKPTVKEIKHSINSIKHAVYVGSETFRSRASEASILLASTTYGFLTGIKNYLASYKNSEKSYNGSTNNTKTKV